MNDVEKFKAAIRPFADGWKSIDVRVVSCLVLGKWINLGTRVLLSDQPQSKPSDVESLPTLPWFRALHEILDVQELDNLLSQIERGVITISGQQVQFGKIEGNQVTVDPPNPTLIKKRKGIDGFRPDFDFPAIFLVSGRERIFNLLHNYDGAPGRDELDSQLLSLQTPYDGLEDLLLNFLMLPRSQYRSTDLVLLDVIAPIQLRFGSDCKLSENKADIHVEAFGFQQVQDVSVGIIRLSGGTPFWRSSVAITKSDWTEQGDFHSAKKVVRVDAASSAHLLLVFRGHVLEKKTVTDPVALLQNFKILAYSHFDDNLKTLEKYLAGKGPDPSEDFEIGVALLLHFCGFNAGPYGRVKGIHEEIDLIAFSSFAGEVLAVECTTKDIDINGKLTKLSRRVKELYERLIPLDIIPLIFTPLTKERIAKTELQKAATEGIGVVAAEQIQSILEMAGQNKDPESILEYLRSQIQKPDDAPFWRS